MTHRSETTKPDLDAPALGVAVGTDADGPDNDVPEAGGSFDWSMAYPADPAIMVSVEGDRRGLAHVQRTARDRRNGSTSP